MTPQSEQRPARLYVAAELEPGGHAHHAGLLHRGVFWANMGEALPTEDPMLADLNRAFRRCGAAVWERLGRNPDGNCINTESAARHEEVIRICKGHGAAKRHPCTRRPGTVRGVVC